MKLYLAGAWSRKAEIAAIAQELNQIPGIIVDARWLFEDVPAEYNDAFRRERARMDVEDVRAADILVRFTDDLTKPTVPSGLATGARMFEMGLAYAINKHIIVIGGVQPIFDYLPEIHHITNVDDLKVYLKHMSQFVKAEYLTEVG